MAKGFKNHWTLSDFPAWCCDFHRFRVSGNCPDLVPISAPISGLVRSPKGDSDSPFVQHNQPAICPKQIAGPEHLPY